MGDVDYLYRSLNFNYFNLFEAVNCGFQDYGLDGMKSMSGNDIEKKFVKGFATATGKIPLYEGSCSTAKPGMQPMRAVLRETLADKLFFSGEACLPSRWATVTGGLNAGQISAHQAARYICIFWTNVNT